MASASTDDTGATDPLTGGVVAQPSKGQPCAECGVVKKRKNMLVSEQHDRMKICVDCMAELKEAAGETVDMDELKKEARAQAQSANFGLRVSAYQEATKAVNDMGLKSTARKRQKALVFASRLAKAIKDGQLWEAFSRAKQRMKAPVEIHEKITEMEKVLDQLRPGDGPYEEALKNLEKLMQEEEEAYDYTCFKGHPEQDRNLRPEQK